MLSTHLARARNDACFAAANVSKQLVAAGAWRLGQKHQAGRTIAVVAVVRRRSVVGVPAVALALAGTRARRRRRPTLGRKNRGRAQIRSTTHRKPHDRGSSIATTLCTPVATNPCTSIGGISRSAPHAHAISSKEAAGRWWMTDKPFVGQNMEGEAERERDQIGTASTNPPTRHPASPGKPRRQGRQGPAWQGSWQV